MEIGIFYENLREAMREADDAARFAAAASLGFRYIEIDWRRLKTESDVFFTALAANGLGLATHVFVDENGIQKDGVPFARELPRVAALGIPAVMAVCAADQPAGTDLSALTAPVSRTLDALCGEAERYGVSILLEDFDSDRIPCGSCVDLLRFGKEVPRIGFTADTGNFAYFGEDLLESYASIRDRVRHVHLKDRASLSDLAPCVPGEGVLPLAGFLHTLRRDGYDGRISVEMFGAAREGIDAIARAAAFFFREWEK